MVRLFAPLSNSPDQGEGNGALLTIQNDEPDKRVVTPEPSALTKNRRRGPPARMATSLSSIESNGVALVDDEASEESSEEESMVAVGASSHKDVGIAAIVQQEPWIQQGLSIVVVGASGDLAKKKTYPSLLDLFVNRLLPSHTVIYGYARSVKTHVQLRQQLKPYLLKSSHREDVVDEFLSHCFYHHGTSYSDQEAFGDLLGMVQSHEQAYSSLFQDKHNRLFYLAIPPNVFGATGKSLYSCGLFRNSTSGWSRLVIEKPFGRDLTSCRELSQVLGSLFDESYLFRIDHYLGKELVQNVLWMRFQNMWLEHLWSCEAVQSVVISFQEDITTQGRGGYFDNYGIIRDILQNHLLQVLTLVAMEPPETLHGKDAGNAIRDSKVQVLQNMPVLSLDDTLLGQYDTYADDPTIDNKSTNTPTYAAIRCFVQTPRWKNVPFILEAGKAMPERKCEVRIQFKASSLASTDNGVVPRNELVMRLQPDPAIFMTTNIKSPGFASTSTTVALSMDYRDIFSQSSKKSSANNPDAYTRLILDVLRGEQAAFVRDDELERSWEIFTPLLHTIEREDVRPESYPIGAAGPEGRADFLRRMGAHVVERDARSIGTRQSAL